MKTIMYHYVREYDPDHPNFRFLDVNNFRKQLDYFEHNFGFVDKEEWQAFITSGEMPKKLGKILLTFDDAMSCHYNYVFPELVRRKLWGIFYVPTLPYLDQKLLDVHRIHLLCGAFDGRALINEALKLVTEDMIPDAKREEFKNKTYGNQVNYEGVSEFKRLLNYFVSYDYRDTLIDQIARIFGYEFSAQSFYVHTDRLQEMSDADMVIGSHTINHPVMSKLSREQQKEQIVGSFKTLKEMGVVSNDNKTYCHPYGGFHSFDTNTIGLLKEENVSFSFNVEPREIEASDFVSSMQHLPRFDCNLFEHGKAS